MEYADFCLKLLHTNFSSQYFARLDQRSQDVFIEGIYFLFKTYDKIIETYSAMLDKVNGDAKQVPKFLFVPELTVQKNLLLEKQFLKMLDFYFLYKDIFQHDINFQKQKIFFKNMFGLSIEDKKNKVDDVFYNAFRRLKNKLDKKSLVKQVVALLPKCRQETKDGDEQSSIDALITIFKNRKITDGQKLRALDKYFTLPSSPISKSSGNKLFDKTSMQQLKLKLKEAKKNGALFYSIVEQEVEIQADEKAAAPANAQALAKMLGNPDLTQEERIHLLNEFTKPPSKRIG